MAHGTPDWGLTAGTVTTYQLSDLAELAARLGSIVTFDRRGEVVFLETFEDGLHRWNTSPAGTGAAVDLSRASARSGGHSCRLRTGSTGWTAAGIDNRVGPPTLSPLGLEVSFAMADTLKEFVAQLIVYTGSRVQAYRFRYVSASKIVQVWTAAGAYQTVIANVNLVANADAYHTLKFVVDPVNEIYVRCLLNALSGDVSLIAPQAIDDPTSPHLHVDLEAIGSLATNLTSYVDDVIVTQNEPV